MSSFPKTLLSSRSSKAGGAGNSEVWGERPAALGLGHLPPPRQFSEDAPDTARAKASGGGPNKGGAEDKRAPLAAREPRLVPLSSSSWKRQLQA